MIDFLDVNVLFSILLFQKMYSIFANIKNAADRHAL